MTNHLILIMNYGRAKVIFYFATFSFFGTYDIFGNKESKARPICLLTYQKA